LLQRGGGADGARSGSDLGLAGPDLGLIGTAATSIGDGGQFPSPRLSCGSMPASPHDLPRPTRRLCDVAVGALARVRGCRAAALEGGLRGRLWRATCRWWWFLSLAMWMVRGGHWGTLVLAVFQLRQPRIMCRRPTLETAGVGGGRGAARRFFWAKALCFGTSGGDACGYPLLGASMRLPST
jgi:hypothetical protein